MPTSLRNTDILMNGGATVGDPSGTAPCFFSRAWVNFDGTGTIAIRGSGNVTSITDNGTGDYTVNFTNALPDVNYAALITCGSDFGWSRLGHIESQTNMLTSSCQFTINLTNGGGANVDDESVCVAILR